MREQQGGSRLQSGFAPFQPLTWKKGNRTPGTRNKKKSIRETLTLLQTPPTEKKKRKKIAVDTGGAVIVSLHIVEKTHLLKGSREGLHSQTAKKWPQLLL